jgi:tripeptide aminopeptidase
VAEVTLRILLRDFDTPKLAEYAKMLHAAAQETQRAFPGSSVLVNVTAQYRNMAEGLEKELRAVAFAELAHQKLGRTAHKTIIRGGTDGSRFTELGLPTPNLSTGQHNPHSPLEWACLDEMVEAVAVIVEIAKIWGAAR